MILVGKIHKEDTAFVLGVVVWTVLLSKVGHLINILQTNKQK